ncbi:MAG: acyl-CoA/acyl-ACP dehydrogenase, partial [Bryobacterales bacterium]|nr:acyl-CoA/acyl-ACP dehydrogenase [Bryobacterales bacterium]
MRYELSETQLLLQKSAREFLTNECPMTEVRRIAATATAQDALLWKKMADQGWTGMIFPEEQGGMALGMVEMAAIFEQMGRILLPGPFHSTVALAGPMLSAAGAKQHVESICEGKACATAALLEDTAELDPATWQTRAAESADGWRITGRKLFVPDAAASDWIVCAAHADGELALFAAERGAGAVTDLKSMDITRRLYAVEWNDAPAQLIARGDAARSALAYGLNVATVAMVAEMVGGMQRVLETTVGYAKTRKQFDKPIGQFQAVQHMCADMLMWTESSRSAVYYAAYALQEKLAEADSAVSVAKVYAADAYRESGNRGIQVHGGMGFTWENDLHLYY